MQDRLSRFDTRPGDIHPPSAALYPSQPVGTMTRWLVRMVVDGTLWGEAWKHDSHVWAYSSSDAVGRARADFYGTWASPADRQRLPLRVVEVSQVSV